MKWTFRIKYVSDFHLDTYHFFSIITGFCLFAFKDFQIHILNLGLFYIKHTFAPAVSSNEIKTCHEATAQFFSCCERERENKQSEDKMLSEWEKRAISIVCRR